MTAWRVPGVSSGIQTSFAKKPAKYIPAPIGDAEKRAPGRWNGVCWQTKIIFYVCNAHRQKFIHLSGKCASPSSPSGTGDTLTPRHFCFSCDSDHQTYRLSRAVGRRRLLPWWRARKKSGTQKWSSEWWSRVNGVLLSLSCSPCCLCCSLWQRLCFCCAVRKIRLCWWHFYFILHFTCAVWLLALLALFLPHKSWLDASVFLATTSFWVDVHRWDRLFPSPFHLVTLSRA